MLDILPLLFPLLTNVQDRSFPQSLFLKYISENPLNKGYFKVFHISTTRGKCKKVDVENYDFF
jgi:hypothetical protein